MSRYGSMIVAIRTMLRALALIVASAAIQGSISARAAESNVQGSAPNQLELGRAFEKAGLLEDAEAAYRKALHTSSADSAVEAMDALSRVVTLRTAHHLNLAAILEKGGQLEDASVAYLAVLKAGSKEMQHAALEGLARVSERAEQNSAVSLLEAAQYLKGVRRWENAEELYRKVLESGSEAQQKVALESLGEIADSRASFQEEYLRPPTETFAKAVVSGMVVFLLAALLVTILGRCLRFVAQKRQRNLLSISEFGNAGLLGSPGKTFGETLASTHKRIRGHSISRAVVGDAGKMPLLLGSDSFPVLELMAGINASIVPFTKWFSGVTRQPGYQISGYTEATWFDIKVCVRLEHSSNAIGQWSKTYPLTDWFSAEQDLAYEIMVKLKEYTNAHAT